MPTFFFFPLIPSKHNHTMSSPWVCRVELYHNRYSKLKYWHIVSLRYFYQVKFHQKISFFPPVGWVQFWNNTCYRDYFFKNVMCRPPVSWVQFWNDVCLPRLLLQHCHKWFYLMCWGGLSSGSPVMIGVYAPLLTSRTLRPSIINKGRNVSSNSSF